eukprot:506004-Pleurochrysis_carterae.AAC.1
MRWPLEERASFADADPAKSELLVDGDAGALAYRMVVPKSPRAAEASADAAREGVVPQDPTRPRIGKGYPHHQ